VDSLESAWKMLSRISLYISVLHFQFVSVFIGYLIVQLAGPHPPNGYNPPLREEDSLGPAFVLMFLLFAICFHHYACFVFVYIAIMADRR
jgi:hypothetical protein